MERAIHLTNCDTPLSLDEAMLHFYATQDNYTLYASNSQCIDCSMSEIGGIEQPCCKLWTPHYWDFELRSRHGNETVYRMSKQLGEHGIYSVSVVDKPSGDGLMISFQTTHEPIDSLMPLLIVLMCLLLPILLTCLVSHRKHLHRIGFACFKPSTSFHPDVYSESTQATSLTSPLLDNGDDTRQKTDSDSTPDLEQAVDGNSVNDSTGSSFSTTSTSSFSHLHGDKQQPKRQARAGRSKAPSSTIDGSLSADEDLSAVSAKRRQYSHSIGSFSEYVPSDWQRPSIHKAPVSTSVKASRPRRRNKKNSLNDSMASSGRLSDIVIDDMGRIVVALQDEKLAPSDHLDEHKTHVATHHHHHHQARIDDKRPKAEIMSKERFSSLDTFRGLSLCFMIFVNYGGGGYWFFDHADWNGLTFADLLFPWFMWIMGVSMALSLSTSSSSSIDTRGLLIKATKRSVILFVIGLFLGNGHYIDNWRIPGVLQYFGFSYLVVSWIVIPQLSREKVAIDKFKDDWTKFVQQAMQMQSTDPDVEDKEAYPLSNVAGTVMPVYAPSPTQKKKADSRFSNDAADETKRAGGLKKRDSVSVSNSIGWLYLFQDLWPYKREFVYISVVAILYLILTYSSLFTPDGCPIGYTGPGGPLIDNGKYFGCTGGSLRTFDLAIFTNQHIFGSPTCKRLYSCSSFDPEGAIGGLNAAVLTYLGLMAGRILLHFRHEQDSDEKQYARKPIFNPIVRARISRLLIWAIIWLCLAGILCNFSQNDGVIPINKNLWSTSFVFVTAGAGLVVLTGCYILVDVCNLWVLQIDNRFLKNKKYKGFPFTFLGMNSIMVYFFQAVLHRYFPFSYSVSEKSHQGMLIEAIIGTISWIIVAWYWFEIDFFVKI